MPSAAQQLQELRDTALSLPHSARARLAQELLESLEQENEETDALWAKEAESRLDQIKAGKVKPVPGIEALNRVRNRKR